MQSSCQKEEKSGPARLNHTTRRFPDTCQHCYFELTRILSEGPILKRISHPNVFKLALRAKYHLQSLHYVMFIPACSEIFVIHKVQNNNPDHVYRKGKSFHRFRDLHHSVNGLLQIADKSNMPGVADGSCLNM